MTAKVIGTSTRALKAEMIASEHEQIQRGIDIPEA
jgi:hypothetical protein